MPQFRLGTCAQSIQSWDVYFHCNGARSISNLRRQSNIPYNQPHAWLEY